MKRRDFIAGLGGAAAWPMVARAQRPALPVIGFLTGGAPEGFRTYMAGFRLGLSQEGLVEGQNVAIEFHWANNLLDRLPDLAADLVRQKPAVLLAGSPAAAFAARSASSTIPIVFAVGIDPVKTGPRHFPHPPLRAYSASSRSNSSRRSWNLVSDRRDWYKAQPSQQDVDGNGENRTQ